MRRVEEWRPLPGYEDRYAVSSHGRVRGLSRHEPCGYGAVRWREGRVLKTQTHRRDGRSVLSIVNDAGRKRRYVHQVVAMAFLGPKPDGLEVNHIDGNPHNNCAWNLEYVTRSENCQHAARLGLCRTTPRPGESNPRAKLKEVDVIEIRAARLRGSTYKDLAEKYGVSTSAIWQVTLGGQWSHVR